MKLLKFNATGTAQVIEVGLLDTTQVQLIVGGNAVGSAATVTSYSTIQAALSAIPPGTTSTNVRMVYTVVIPPGTYDEDLTVDITNAHVELVALGAVNIGLFNNTFWAASNTRNITINVTTTAIDSIRSTLGIGTYIPYGACNTTHPSYSTGFRISGSIIWNVTSVGFTNSELYLGAEVFGDVDSSSSVTHNFHTYCTRSRIRGQLKGTRNILQLADWSVFNGLVTCQSYSTVRNSVFDAGMTVSSASGGGFKPFSMVGCDFTGTFTGPASSFKLDNTTDYFFTANGGALAGGATKVFTDGSGAGITQLTGDVTAGPGSGSVAATIAANAVTNAKLATMATLTVKANITGGTAVPTDVAFVSTNTINSGVFRDSSGNFSAGTVNANLIGNTSGGLVTVTGGTAASNSNGGNATVRGAAGSSVGTGGNGGSANLTGADAGGDNTANQSGGAVAITAGNSKGSSAGATVTINGGVGGVGTGTAGASGGAVNLNGGTGGIGSATSGAGAGASLKAGTGGAGVAGGNGGGVTVTGGTGGTGSASGGNGGSATVSGGTAGSFASASGGSASLTGAGGSSTGAGGAGGAVTVVGGAANGDNTQNNTGGSVTVTAGNSKGSSGGAAVTINCGVGGVGTGTAGATGGGYAVNGGAGGVGSATGGAGGNLVYSAGAGGNSASPGAGGFIQFRTAATTSLTERFRIADAAVTVTGAPLVLTTSSLQVSTLGQGIQIKTGTNSKLGTAVLVGGTVTVSNTSVTTNSRIFLTSQSDGGTPGFLRITAKTAATSFVITSSNAADTSTVAWMIVESIP